MKWQAIGPSGSLLSCWEYIRRSNIVIGKVKMIQKDGSMGKAAHAQTWPCEHHPQASLGGRTEPTSTSCPLASSDIVWHTHAWLWHTQRDKYDKFDACEGQWQSNLIIWNACRAQVLNSHFSRHLSVSTKPNRTSFHLKWRMQKWVVLRSY